MTALSTAMAFAQDLGELNDRILDDTGNVELNLQYARLAEQNGELRLALAAYERILINNPDNEEAKRGFTRVRRILEPAYSTLRVEVGVQWDTNQLNLGDWDEETYSAYWRVSGVDERRLGAQRWRTNVNFDGEIVPDIKELNYARLAAQTGPLKDVTPSMAAHPAVGVAVASLDGSFYYAEANAGVTLEGQRDGVSYWARARAGWRSYSEESAAEEGAQAEVAVGVSIPRLAAQRDALTIVPWARWSGVEGSTFDAFNNEVAPGEYAEYGIDANYQFQFNDHVVVSAGALAYNREYTSTEVGGQTRRDVYVSPQTTVTFQNILPCQCAMNLTWRWRVNDSNDPLADYDAQQMSAGIVARF
ncbi:MAG TPA: hypothetical protein VFO00_13085 [Vitreimonas sp.]|nr:hypothetical protein [Vitreimonas sp.]